jgi:Domain of unknown function (DUF5666)
MRTQATLSIIGAAAATGAEASTSASTAAVNTPHAEGRIIAVNRPAHTFTVRDAQRGTLKVTVTPRTKFDRIAGFSALRTSERVDVRATASNGSWSATNVEPAGAAGRHNGADDPAGHERHNGADDPVGHERHNGADDPAGHR